MPSETLPLMEAVEMVSEVPAEYIPYLESLVDRVNYITAFLLFFVVVLLCYFSYKFLRIFF